MKLHKSFLLAPVVVLSLSSCAIIRQRVSIDKYILNYLGDKPESPHDAVALDADGDFNILQLSDIHMSAMDDADQHYAFIQKTINEAKAVLAEEKVGVDQTSRKLHLIAISGDVFTFSTKDTVYKLCEFFESQKIPWTLTFGNHDEQGYYPIDWLTSYLTDLSNKYESNLLFRDFPNDDVFGSANFVIDLPIFNGDGKFQPRQIVMIDSNRYNYGEGYGYDYIHGDQIDWYIRVCEEMRLKYKLREEYVTPNSLAFFHIPVPEYLDAYNDAKNGEANSTFLKSNVYTYENNDWTKKEDFTRDVHIDSGEGSPKVNTGFFETVQDLGYTKGFFVGHAHMNNNCMDYRPKNTAVNANTVALCYGVKSTDRVYMDESMLGGQLIRYHSQHKPGMEDYQGSAWFDTDLIYHKYTDLKEGE